MNKLVLAIALTLSTSSVFAETITGKFTEFRCASVMAAPAGSNKASETYNFKSGYYDRDFDYRIEMGKGRSSLTTSLYSGKFKYVGSSSNAYNFINVYSGGTDVAIISINKDMTKMTYSNNGGAINRLCKASLI